MIVIMAIIILPLIVMEDTFRAGLFMMGAIVLWFGFSSVVESMFDKGE